jgi:hypothetical protein
MFMHHLPLLCWSHRATAAPAVPFLEDGLPHKKLVADAASVFRVCGETRVVDDSDRTSASLSLPTHFVSV